MGDNNEMGEMSMGSTKYDINLTNDERETLINITNKHTAKQCVVKRAEIILKVDEGIKRMAIVPLLGLSGECFVTKWVKRWVELSDKSAEERLQDLPRSGAKDTFTPEQVCQIIATACTAPETFGLPITHWTHKELRDEVVKQGIVESISASHIGRILRQTDIKPHQTRYWLNGKPDEKKDERIKEICEVYHNAGKNTDELTTSMDEITGVQALERAAPDLPMRPGKPVAREFEYIRHGTQTLTAGINVATGTVQGLCLDTRTEVDFVNSVKHIISGNPGFSVYHFVVDQLNTHKSESLVRFVTDFCGIEIGLGEKGKSGILKSMETREQYLNTPDKGIIFHYTPKHASWMNQIEIWFGILVKKVIKRGNFTSKANLKEKILKFIDYFNETLAKPFKWTYQGKVLKA